MIYSQGALPRVGLFFFVLVLLGRESFAALFEAVLSTNGARGSSGHALYEVLNIGVFLGLFGLGLLQPGILLIMRP